MTAKKIRPGEIMSKAAENPAFRLLGVVLAGGLSRRMGRDKAMLRAFGQSGPTMLERAMRVVGGLCDQCVVSTTRPYPPYHCIYDQMTGHGPIDGVISSLEYARANAFSHALILACDLPLLRADLLARLVRSIGDKSLGSFFVNARTGIVEMLAGIYATRALPVLRASVKNEIYGLYSAISPNFMDLVPFEEDEAAAFVNCNNAQDLEKIDPDQT